MDSGSFWNAGSPDSAGVHDPHATLPFAMLISTPAPTGIPAEKFSPSLVSKRRYFLGPRARVPTSLYPFFICDSANQGHAFTMLPDRATITANQVQTFGQLRMLRAWHLRLGNGVFLVPTYAHPIPRFSRPKIASGQQPWQPWQPAPCTLVYKNLPSRAAAWGQALKYVGTSVHLTIFVTVGTA